MIEIIYEQDQMRVVVTDGMAHEVGDRLKCPKCGVPAGFLIAWFTENVIKPVRAYQLLACTHEFDTRTHYLHAQAAEGERVQYEIRPVPEDRKYDPVATAVEAALWRTAGGAESTRDNFHLYGGL